MAFRPALLFPAVLAMVSGLASAQTVGTCSPALADAYLEANRVRARILNNGSLFYRGEPHVYNVPKDTRSNAIFASAIWLAGSSGGTLRVAATRYGPYEFWAGPLDDDGNPPSDCAAYDRMYSVTRKDVAKFDSGRQAAPDLRDWPTGLGAPTLDAHGRRIEVMDVPLSRRVHRVIDLGAGERPALTGDQTVWWVMNDLGNTHGASKGEPIGVEVHGEAFAFDTFNDIGDATFYRYRIFYRGADPLTGAYVGIFSDPDLGDFADDWIGSDSTLGLLFMYNSDNEDGGGEGYGTPPPAVGYDLMQGPVVPSPGDMARARGMDLPDHRNLTAALLYHEKSTGNFAEPLNGQEYYLNLTGRFRNGDPITFGGLGHGFSTTPTRYVFPGDPISGAFWSMRNIDGLGTPTSSGDKRFYLSAGPFSMQPGDEQEIVFAIVWARGADNFDSVRALRDADRLAKRLYAAGFEDVTPPDAPNVTVHESDRRVGIAWTNAPNSNNFEDSFHRADPFVEGAAYELEGYEVVRFAGAADSVGQVIAVYDRANGVTTVVEDRIGDLPWVAAEGVDSGLAHAHTIDGLTNHRTFHFGVRAYAHGARSTPRVLRSATTRVAAVPTLRPGTPDDPAAASDALRAIGIVPNPYRGASAYETDRLRGEVRFTNMPEEATVRIFNLNGTLIRTLVKRGPETVLRWDLTTDNRLPVGGGVYLVHVLVPDVGERVLKFAVARQRPHLTVF